MDPAWPAAGRSTPRAPAGQHRRGICAVVLALTLTAHRQTRIEPYAGGGFWTRSLPWYPLSWVVTLAWVVALVLMFTNRRPAYAERLAWFWLFGWGQVGVFAYLWLEPRPLLSRGSPAVGAGERKPISFWRGLAYAAVLWGVVELVLAAWHWLLGPADRHFAGELISPVRRPG